MKLKVPEDLTVKAEYLMLSLEDKVKLLKFCYGYEDEEGNLPSDIIFDNMVAALPDSSYLKNLDWDLIEYDDVADIMDQVGIRLIDDGEEVITDSDLRYTYLQDLWGKNKSITMDDDINHSKGIVQKMFNIYSDEKYKDEIYKILMLLKYDGWNITVYYVPGEGAPVLAHTRARSGSSNCLYCTDILRDLMPRINTDEPVRVVGELCLDVDALPILRKHYPMKKFKNTRNSISSVVHGTIDINLIKEHVHFYAFSVETPNEKAAPTVADMLTLLNGLGFETPEACVVESMDTFDASFEHMTREYKAIESHIKCDGVVVEPNHYEVQKQCFDFVAGSNQLGLLAIKDLYWSRKLYEGKVIDIISPPSEVKRSLIAIIEPTETTSGSEVKRVPLLNFNIASKYGRYVDIGDTILFTYHSDQIVHFEGFKEMIE